MGLNLSMGEKTTKINVDEDTLKALEYCEVGEVLSWQKVSEIHKIRNGIFHRNGRLVSLLTDFGKINPCYPDFHGDSRDLINYTGSGRRGDQKLDSYNRALLDEIDSGHAVPLFNKLGVGRWEFMGFWRVVDGEYVFDDSRERMIWRFKLERIVELEVIEQKESISGSDNQVSDGT
jgi:hypothetical protein